jgi:hypothetical protein
MALLEPARPAEPLNEASNPILPSGTSLNGSKMLAGPDQTTPPSVEFALRTNSTPVGLVVYDHSIPTVLEVVDVVHVPMVKPLAATTKLTDSSPPFGAVLAVHSTQYVPAAATISPDPCDAPEIRVRVANGVGIVVVVVET